jgi:hypothetical protein
MQSTSQDNYKRDQRAYAMTKLVVQSASTGAACATRRSRSARTNAPSVAMTAAAPRIQLLALTDDSPAAPRSGSLHSGSVPQKHSSSLQSVVTAR